MYKSILLLFVCFFMIQNLYSQNSGIVEYGVDYVGPSRDTSSVSSRIEVDFILQNDNKSKLFLDNDQSFTILKFNQDFSTYNVLPRLEQDEEDHIIEIVALLAGNYFVEIDKDKKYQISQIKGKDVLVDFSREVEWEILDEYKTILGFTCQKAISRVGDKFDFRYVEEAWFTNEIQSSTGPHSFGGLPGLILELQFKGRKIYAKNIDFTDEIDFSEYKEMDTYTQREYVRSR